MGQAPCTSITPLLTHYSVSMLSVNDTELHNSLQRFWLQEELHPCNKRTAEEELCDKHFDATHARDSDGRYIVSLPFKQAHPPLGASKLAAERRFRALEHKFRTQPNFSELYHEFMSDYLLAGHMEKVSTIDLSQPHYFLPHHGVLKVTSSTTKLRTVFDASAQTSTGISLNDVLLTGRKLQTDICDILLNFRVHNVVFTCDIRQMYRQIRVRPEDQNFQLILWREDPSHELDIYKLTTVTYGLNSFPYLAIKTLGQLVKDEGEAFPDAARIIISYSYVDDIITGSVDEESALQLQGQLIALLKKGGFELRKWSSNSPRLLEAVPEDHRETPVFLQDPEQPHYSILGLHWSPTTDSFSYHLDLPSGACTKRQLLSNIARIYDPCGFLAPITMWCKCLMQLLWTQQLGWDEPISSDLADKWHSFVSELSEISQINIPRAFHFSESRSMELHGFSDASERGYAAVVYTRCLTSNNTVIVRQVIAKTRVAPLKKVTLPRLELCAAH
ncbi:uncharacterized protein LOC128999903 [Macrosteles quadrilineatus]|uniref:uncharacterized protein LOC128999903 n=1 Tax=Macrosteles quadrilineatus TaxID=74068 RepID=UPI0023E0BBD7|nr:uncharacterized protein LOC128999903 [Macrosteles quadrilineatus]